MIVASRCHIYPFLDNHNVCSSTSKMSPLCTFFWIGDCWLVTFMLSCFFWHLIWELSSHASWEHKFDPTSTWWLLNGVMLYLKTKTKMFSPEVISLNIFCTITIVSTNVRTKSQSVKVCIWNKCGLGNLQIIWSCRSIHNGGIVQGRGGSVLTLRSSLDFMKNN